MAVCRRRTVSSLWGLAMVLAVVVKFPTRGKELGLMGGERRGCGWVLLVPRASSPRPPSWPGSSPSIHSSCPAFCASTPRNNKPEKWLTSQHHASYTIDLHYAPNTTGPKSSKSSVAGPSHMLLDPISFLTAIRHTSVYAMTALTRSTFALRAGPFGLPRG